MNRDIELTSNSISSPTSNVATPTAAATIRTTTASPSPSPSPSASASASTSSQMENASTSHSAVVPVVIASTTTAPISATALELPTSSSIPPLLTRPISLPLPLPHTHAPPSSSSFYHPPPAIKTTDSQRSLYNPTSGRNSAGRGTANKKHVLIDPTVQVYSSTSTPATALKSSSTTTNLHSN